MVAIFILPATISSPRCLRTTADCRPPYPPPNHTFLLDNTRARALARWTEYCLHRLPSPLCIATAFDTTFCAQPSFSILGNSIFAAIMSFIASSRCKHQYHQVLTCHRQGFKSNNIFVGRRKQQYKNEIWSNRRVLVKYCDLTMRWW